MVVKAVGELVDLSGSPFYPTLYLDGRGHRILLEHLMDHPPGIGSFWLDTHRNLDKAQFKFSLWERASHLDDN